MKRLPLSRPAAGLVRALSRQTEASDHRILLTDVRSVDWQSLTFAGEQHKIAVTLVGSDPGKCAQSLLEWLGEAEFSITGHIVADIAGQLLDEDKNGSVSVAIEALTIAE